MNCMSGTKFQACFSFCSALLRRCLPTWEPSKPPTPASHCCAHLPTRWRCLRRPLARLFRFMSLLLRIHVTSNPLYNFRSILFFLQAIVQVVDDLFNEKGESTTDGQATIGYKLAEARCIHSIFVYTKQARKGHSLSQMHTVSRKQRHRVRSWACSKRPRWTCTKKPAECAIPCTSFDACWQRLWYREAHPRQGPPRHQ